MSLSDVAIRSVPARDVRFLCFVDAPIGWRISAVKMTHGAFTQVEYVYGRTDNGEFVHKPVDWYHDLNNGFNEEVARFFTGLNRFNAFIYNNGVVEWVNRNYLDACMAVYQVMYLPLPDDLRRHLIGFMAQV